uniref:Uncharacterized protein n=1 Tax=Setaria italica TaxID=4555 RepID=K3XRX7_SETIT
MPGLLRRAALTIALAFGSPYRLRPFTGVFLSSLPPSASGHLGLVRSRPGLLDLNSLFTPKVFLDATHALGAAALHYQPFLGGRLRTLRDMAPNLQAAAGDDEGAKVGQMPLPPGPRLAAAFELIYEKMWGTAFDGDMSVVKKVLITALLNHLVKTKLHKDAVVSLHTVLKLLRFGTGSSIAPPSTIPIFAYVVLQASQALPSAVVLHASPLTGDSGVARISEGAGPWPTRTTLWLCPCRGTHPRRYARCQARPGARYGTRGHPAVADLRLLLAFLAARDGRFNQAMERYTEAAQEHPSDPRLHYSVHLLFPFGEHMEECDKWKASYERLAAGSSDEDRAAYMVLKEELVVALTLGGAPTACSDSYPAVLREIVGAAGSRVDAALVAALQDKGLSIVERLELRAIRTYVYGEMWSALKELKDNDGGSGTATE